METVVNVFGLNMVVYTKAQKNEKSVCHIATAPTVKWWVACCYLLGVCLCVRERRHFFWFVGR